MIEIYEVKERINADNNKAAQKTKELLKKNKTFFINLMASPGAGKTTLLTRTIESLKDTYRIGVMEADVDSSIDAQTIAQSGIRVIQLHSGGLCHMDADMTYRGLEKLGIQDLDLIFLENIGNLVCPAEFDVGAQMKVMILSIPEGDDKPLKYPLMFETSDVLLITKIDTMSYFNFDMDKCIERVKYLNPDIKIFPVSAKTGEGMDKWEEWLIQETKEWKKVDA